jgi:hypothetical protein
MIMAARNIQICASHDPTGIEATMAQIGECLRASVDRRRSLNVAA